MEVFTNPARELWSEICRRPQISGNELDSAVREILKQVRDSGDDAVRELTLRFDKASVTTLRVSDQEIANATASLSFPLKEAIEVAASNILKFHLAQLPQEIRVETMPGVTCWRKAKPINRVGIYIPGGTAPLFSTVLMLGIPASIAGCAEIILCTPPDENGNVHPTILYAAQKVGIKKIFKSGGAQAVAAMAYGTQSIPKVDKLFGPGNQFVTKAKQLLMETGLAIDIPAGPSEVLVFADSSADPEFVAADLLSQAEHGSDSQVMLVLSDDSMLSTIRQFLSQQLNKLPRKQVAEKAIVNSCVVIIPDITTAVHFINEYAPEHLIINVREPDDIVNEIRNAGSVFIGNYSAEALGDYATGTNHTLPTNGYARAYSGVSVETFMKYITYQHVTETGIKNIGPIVEEMADAEQLYAHKNAVRVRLQKLN